MRALLDNYYVSEGGCAGDAKRFSLRFGRGGFCSEMLPGEESRTDGLLICSADIHEHITSQRSRGQIEETALPHKKVLEQTGRKGFDKVKCR